MAFRIFIDTNIFLDHLLNRNEFSTRVFEGSEKRIYESYASTSSFYTIAYFLQKYGVKDSVTVLRGYTSIVELIPTFQKNIESAFQSDFRDLEDAFQYNTALNEKSLDYFITNNIKDYKRAVKKLPVVSAEEFVNRKTLRI